jgi:hypothetical protein
MPERDQGAEGIEPAGLFSRFSADAVLSDAVGMLFVGC